jgi:F0F1-type ATP synthase assembly protein I
MAFLVVGSEMVSFTLFGLLIDYLIGSLPWATAGLTVLGVVVAFVHLVRMATRQKPPT